MVVVCEHAGRAIPQALGALGLPPGAVDLHIGWDIGAAAVARGLARRLGAAAILQPYSRLVIDCNRPLGVRDSIPETSDGVEAPGNRGLSQRDREAREREIFAPFHAAVAAELSRLKPRLALSIHSYTASLGGVERRWDAGLLFRKDERTSALLLAALRRRRPELEIGCNVPYDIDDESDYFVPVHGEGRGIPHSLVEIRNDHLRDEAGCEGWAALLADCVRRSCRSLPHDPMARDAGRSAGSRAIRDPVHRRAELLRPPRRAASGRT